MKNTIIQELDHNTLMLAEAAGITHEQAVNRTIDAMTNGCSPEYRKYFFEMADLVDANGKEVGGYKLSSTSFHIILFSFDTPQAIAYKIGHIKRFFAMADELGINAFEELFPGLEMDKLSTHLRVVK